MVWKWSRPQGIQPGGGERLLLTFFVNMRNPSFKRVLQNLGVSCDLILDSIDHCRVVVCPPCHLGMLDLEVGGLLSCSAMKNPLLVQVGDLRIDPNSKARQLAAYFVNISRLDDLPLN
jgi:hypothetical protein